MSDDEYYSDNNSENNDSDEEIVIPSSKKPLFKPSVNIKSYNTSYNIGGDDIDDSEPDDADVEEDEIDEDDDEQIGGDDELESGEIDEDEGDDAEPEEEDDEEAQNDSDIEIDEDGEPIEKVTSQKPKSAPKTKKLPLIIQEDEEDDDEYDDNYLQKFDNDIIKNYINEFHPECLNNNYDEIQKLSIVTKNSEGIIIDPLHRTIPYLTKYEKARVLGMRAKQIETNSKPLVSVPDNVVDSYIIAELELREKKIPFIIRRPIPGGGFEYWNLKDLEIIAF